LVANSTVQWMWSRIDKSAQVWIQPSEGASFPEPGEQLFDTRDSAFTEYAQKPSRSTMTSTLVNGISAHHRALEVGATDWNLNYRAQSRRVEISTSARIREISNGTDWLETVTRFPAQCADRPREDGDPWLPNNGLRLDWDNVAQEYDGIHITLWAYLTATQVRLSSQSGWTEPWAWEGEETTWLNYCFSRVEEPTPVDLG